MRTYEVTPWEYPDNYFGATWHNYYSAGVGKSRDSSALERANFDAMLKMLGGESDEGVIVVRENHWAVGWVEWIAIHMDLEDKLAIARAACDDLNNYPVLDEDLHSRYEWDECAQVWESCYSPRERVKYLRDHSYTGSFRDLLAAVRGDWGAAANVLHCPSDLLY